MENLREAVLNGTSLKMGNSTAISDSAWLSSDLFFAIYGDAYFSSHRIGWVRFGLILLYTIFAAIGVTTNGAVVFLLVFWNRNALRNITNRFVLALAISDILMCSFNMSIQAYYEMQETVYFSDITCRLVFSTFGLPMHISCLVILVIAIDRYRIIVQPLKRRMSRRSATIALIAIVVVSLVSVIPIAVFSKNSPAKTSFQESKVKQSEYFYCVEEWPNPEIRLCYGVFTFIVQFLLPLLLTATLYIRIYFRLHERRFRKRDLKRKRRTNKILVAIVICFFVCWTPWNIFSLFLEARAYIAHKSRPHQLHGNVSHAKLLALQQLLVPILLKVQNVTAHKRHSLSDIVPQNLLLFGGHAKLIDLLLKLLAMCSGCLNPCLYGWMTDTMRVLVKRVAARMRANRTKTRARQRRSWPFCHRSEHEKTQRKQDACRMNALGTGVYSMYFCGFRVMLRTGFHQKHEQRRNLYSKKNESKHQSSEARTSSAKGNRASSLVGIEGELTLEGDNRHAESSNNMPENIAYGLHRLDPASLTFTHRGSHTLSIDDFSTKRTSLLPSSVYDKTPRNSLLGEIIKPGDNQTILNLSNGAIAEPHDRLPNYPPKPVNRYQTVVDIEVHPMPKLLTAAPPADPYRRKSSSKNTSKPCKVLATLEEVSCAFPDTDGEVIPVKTIPVEVKRNLFQRSLSVTFESDPSPRGWGTKQHESFQIRRQSTFGGTESLVPSSKTLSKPVEKGNCLEAPSYDDFAHLHKIIREGERLKASMGLQLNSINRSSIQHHPRRPSFYKRRQSLAMPKRCAWTGGNKPNQEI